MRALVFDVFGGALMVREVADPVAPPGGVVVEVGATGVCRSDWHGWQGHDRTYGCRTSPDTSSPGRWRLSAPESSGGRSGTG